MPNPSQAQSHQFHPLPRGTNQTVLQDAAKKLSGGAEVVDVAAVTGALSAPGAYAHLTAKPITDVTARRFVLGQLKPMDVIVLSIWLTKAAGASNSKGKLGFWFLSEWRRPNGVIEYRGVYLGSVIVTAGAAQHNDYAAGVGTWVDTFDLTGEGSFPPGMRTEGQTASDGSPDLVFDSLGHGWLVVETADAGSSQAEYAGLAWRQA